MKKSVLFIRIGLLLIATAFLLSAYNIFAATRAERASQKALDALLSQIEIAKQNSLDLQTLGNQPLYESYPQMDMPAIEIDGKNYIGIIKIDSLNLALPVKGEFSYSGLRAAPCRYSGSVYTDDMIIAGHNYAKHFSQLKNLNIGDTMSFTDGDGNVFNYQVSEILQINGNDVEAMKSGEWDLTLFTCTMSGRDRVTIRLIKIK